MAIKLIVIVQSKYIIIDQENLRQTYKTILEI